MGEGHDNDSSCGLKGEKECNDLPAEVEKRCIVKTFPRSAWKQDGRSPFEKSKAPRKSRRQIATRYCQLNVIDERWRRKE